VSCGADSTQNNSVREPYPEPQPHNRIRMPRLLLHIGHPKTGTTALQSVLSANAETLLNTASILYPTKTEPAEFKHAFVIPWLFQADNESIRRRSKASGNELKEISKQYWHSLATEVQQTNHNLSILSAEGFWSIVRRAPEGQSTFFHKKLYEIANHVTVIAYLKSPAPYFLSKINQKLRNFRAVTLPRPNYLSGAIQDWENIGFDDYSWRIFDRTLLTNQDIVDDFCSHYLADSLNTTSLRREGVEQANSSVSNEALVILEELTAAHPVLLEDVYDQRRYKIIEILKQSDRSIGGQSRPSLKESAAAGIVKRCSDLGWLQDRGLSFPDIDPAWIHQTPTTDLPETFTCVSDFCPIDSDRLAELRGVASEAIEALFRPKPKRVFWRFPRLHKR